MNKKRLEDVKKKCQYRHTKQQQQWVAVKKEWHERALEEVKLENLSTEEANEVLADIDLVIDLEDIEQFEDGMGTLTWFGEYWTVWIMCTWM